MTDLTPQQTATLADLADKINAGRSLAKWIIHMFAALGAVVSVVAAVTTIINAWRH